MGLIQAVLTLSFNHINKAKTLIYETHKSVKNNGLYKFQTRQVTKLQCAW